MEWVESYKNTINSGIELYFSERYSRTDITDQEKDLQEAIRYAVNFGTPSRIHPMLAMVVYEEVLGLTADTALPVFIGLEFVYSGLKLHAELLGLEEEKNNHGNTPFLKKYGESITLLAGDALVSLGMECLAKGAKLDLIQEVLRAIDDTGMVRGFTRDVLLDHTSISEAEYIALHDEELARLITSSCMIGAYLSSAAPQILIDQLRRYSVFLCRIYQVKKDIALYESSSGNNESSRGKSVVDFLGIEKTKALYENLEFELLKMTRDFQSSKFADLIQIFSEGNI